MLPSSNAATEKAGNMEKEEESVQSEEETERESQKKKRKRGSSDDVGSPQLKALLDRKEAMEKSLLHLETQIYALETSYLEDTHARGNIIRGLSFLKDQTWLCSRLAKLFRAAGSGVAQKSPVFRQKPSLFALFRNSIQGIKWNLSINVLVPNPCFIRQMEWNPLVSSPSPSTSHFW